MNDTERLMKLAGLLNEDTTTFKDASAILMKNGVDTRHLDDNAVRAALAGKTPVQAKEIIDAYHYVRSPQDWHKQNSSKPASSENIAPVWALGKNPTIRKNDLTDLNYIRKTLWELSGKPEKGVITAWSFDGKDLNQHFLLLAKPKIWKEIAKATVGYTRGKSKAVFISGPNSDKFVLLYLDGRVLDEPVVLNHKSFNKNPENDWQFIGELPRKLAEIKSDLDKGSEFQVSDFKAWINVQTDQVVSFPASETFFDAMKNNAETLGIRGLTTKTYLQARVAAERKGWVAAGINVASEDTVGAMVIAMTPEQAHAGAKLLYKNQRGGSVVGWTTLTIKSNDDSIKLVGRQEIIHYLKTGQKPQGSVFL